MELRVPACQASILTADMHPPTPVQRYVELKQDDENLPKEAMIISNVAQEKPVSTERTHLVSVPGDTKDELPKLQI